MAIQRISCICCLFQMMHCALYLINQRRNNKLQSILHVHVHKYIRNICNRVTLQVKLWWPFLEMWPTIILGGPNFMASNSTSGHLLNPNWPILIYAIIVNLVPWNCVPQCNSLELNMQALWWMYIVQFCVHSIPSLYEPTPIATDGPTSWVSVWFSMQIVTIFVYCHRRTQGMHSVAYNAMPSASLGDI